MMAGRHRKRSTPPDVSPLETRPDGTWLPPDWLASAEGGAEARDEAFAAFWGAAEDVAEDGELSTAARERLMRAVRTLAQGAIAAVAVAVAPAVWGAVTGPDGFDLGETFDAVKVAAVAALVAYVMPKKK